MQNAVNGKGARLAKTFAAILTFERFLFGMNVFMIAEMILPPESFAANITIERTFVCMSSFVNQQVVGFCEFAMAKLANVFPSFFAGVASCLFAFVGCLFLVISEIL